MKLEVLKSGRYKNEEFTIAITDKKKIMGLRHILVHDYDKVLPETLYMIITKNTGLLKDEVEAILQKYPPQGSMNLDD